MRWLGKPKLGVCEKRNLRDTMPMSPDSPSSSPSDTFEGEEPAGQETQAPPSRTVKSEQHATPSAPASGRSSQRESEDDLRVRFTHKEKASCTMYRVNLLSASFGECLCGLPKASHSDEALKQNAENGGTGMTTRRDEKELRSKFVQREYVECANYEVDMGPGVQYGMCKCGAPRAEHSNAALQGGKREFKAKRSNQDVIAQMKARAAATEAAATEAIATETAAITHDPPTRENEAEAKVAKRDAHQSPAGVTHAAALEAEDTAEALPLASSPALREAEEAQELEQAQAESVAEALSPQPFAVAQPEPMRVDEGVGSFIYTVLEQFVSPSKGVEKRSRCGCL